MVICLKAISQIFEDGPTQQGGVRRITLRFVTAHSYGYSTQSLFSGTIPILAILKIGVKILSVPGGADYFYS